MFERLGVQWKLMRESAGSQDSDDPCMDATMGTTFVSASQRNGSQEALHFKVFCGTQLCTPFSINNGLTLESHTRSNFSEGELWGTSWWLQNSRSRRVDIPFGSWNIEQNCRTYRSTDESRGLGSVEHGVSDSLFFSVAPSHALQQFISNSVQMMLRQFKTVDVKALGQHFQLDISQATRGNILPFFH